MGAQLAADTRQKDGKLERLGDIVIGPRIQPVNRIGVGVLGGQHDNRTFHPLLAHQAAQLAAIGVG